jgi:hypothetical protein
VINISFLRRDRDREEKRKRDGAINRGGISKFSDIGDIGATFMENFHR